jgi:hypothetical protein
MVIQDDLLILAMLVFSQGKETMVKRKATHIWVLMAAVMLTALACTCGAISQAQEGVQTAQAISTQAQGLATEIEDSGILETAQAAATAGLVETLQAAGTSVEGATSGEVPDDIPIYEPNAGVNVISGVISYQAQGDLATVTAFYKTEMANNGWELTQDYGQALLFTKGDRTATMTLTDAQGSTVVGIQVAP